MWSVAPIIGVAVGGAVVLLTIGVVLAVSVERRRHQRLMQRHGLVRGLSAYHKAKLSANEHNYRHVPSPKISPRGGLPPCAVEASRQQLWHSQEHLTSQAVSDSPTRTTRRQSLCNSLYIPKTRRLRKIEKAIHLKRVPRSPLSAITEFTDSSNGDSNANEDLVKNPSRVSSRVSGRQLSVNWPLTKDVGIRLVNDVDPSDVRVPNSVLVANSNVNDVNGNSTPAVVTRSVSGNNIFDAPNHPLPALPNMEDLVRRTSQYQRWRASASSIDTVSSSVLGASISAPADMQPPLTRMHMSSGVQTFDFGLVNQETVPKLGDVPGKRASQGYRNGPRGIASVHPSMDFQQQKAGGNEHGATFRAVVTNSQQSGHDDLKTFDASTWTTSSTSTLVPASQVRYSVQCGRSLSHSRPKATIEDTTGRSAGVESLPRRPASVASSNACHWKSKPDLQANRRSLDSSDFSKKGHKRQNCVRISNIPIIEPLRPTGVSQMPALAEEPNEALMPSQMQTKIPGLDLLEAGQKVPLLAMSSGSEGRHLESPLQKRLVLAPTTKLKRPTYIRANSSGSLDNSRQDSGIINSKSVGIPEICISSPPHWPLSPIPPHHPRLNAVTTPLRIPQPPYSSPTLPSPLMTTESLFATRKSLVKGPRTLPISPIAERPGSSISTRSKRGSIQKHRNHDLRRSVMLFRSMNSEGRLSDLTSQIHSGPDKQPTGSTARWEEMAPSQDTKRSSALSVKSPTGSCINSPDPFKAYISTSPSAISTGGASIWEDASVRADSPEPEMPSIRGSPYFKSNPTMNSPLRGLDHDPEAYENFVQQQSTSKHWSGKMAYRSPQGKGLGLRVGNAILGTPGSLYDVEGFLKE